MMTRSSTLKVLYEQVARLENYVGDRPLDIGHTLSIHAVETFLELDL